MKKVLLLISFSLFFIGFVSGQSCAACNALAPPPGAPHPNPVLAAAGWTMTTANPYIPGGTPTTLYCEYDGADVCQSFFLPVEMTDFSAVFSDGKVEIKWETASETNNAGFIVERSFTGKDFQELGQVQGFGTTVNGGSYEFIDSDVSYRASANIAQYRLKQIDQDGSANFSKIITVALKAEGGFVINNISAYSSQNNVSIFYENNSEELVTASVYSLTGKVVSQVTSSSNEGLNVITIDMANYTKGLYFFSLSNGVEVVTQKFIW